MRLAWMLTQLDVLQKWTLMIKVSHSVQSCPAA